MTATAAARDAALAQREQRADRREQVLAHRERALAPREDAMVRRAALDAQAQSQLREANERLVVAAVQAQVMTEAAQDAAAQLSHMASHDYLTNLPNRALLTDRLAQAMTLARRRGKRVALMYLDVDHFKQVNDSHGHSVGDALLQLLARRLQDCVRQSDTVCRQGGDEFVVLLAEVEQPADAALAAAKLIDALASPCVIGEHQLQVGVSIGVSIYPDDAADVEGMLRNADTAMYHAKRNGRNHYQLFQPAMNLRAVVRQSVEAALRQAIDGDGFVLHYQPTVDLVTGAVTGAEALLRLRQADHALMLPGHFVGIAEDSGLIVPIGKWVLRQACQQAVRWLHGGLAIGQIAVNVSAVEFHGSGFFAGVQATLGETGLDPAHLTLELTESGLMQDTESTIALLHALRKMGVQVAVDDFGTGYSSLSYLRRFPVDTLKIDQSFVYDIQDGKDEALLVSAIIAMGRSLNLQVVAEGVETSQQLAYLQAHQCVKGQGYLFSPPVEADTYAELVAGHQYSGGAYPSWDGHQARGRTLRDTP